MRFAEPFGVVIALGFLMWAYVHLTKKRRARRALERLAKENEMLDRIIESDRPRSRQGR